MKAQITTPIYYPNARPHLGHAYTTIAADALARWLRARGAEVRVVTGTDEHAEKIARVAAEHGKTPEEFVSSMRWPFLEMMQRVGVEMPAVAEGDEPPVTEGFAFWPTHDATHVADVQRLFSSLRDAGHVYKGVYEGWYNVRESAFVTEREAKASGYKDPVTGTDLDRVEEPAWFFRLTEWAPKVVELLEDKPGFVRPAGRRNEVLARLRGDVEDLCITRPRARHDWGVPVPDDEEFVVYVWFDALITYMTGAGWEREDDWEERWRHTLHILGKDILWFHAAIWPAMLMAAGLPLPWGMFVHGYLTVGGEKMSKSLGNVIDPLEVGEGFGPHGDEVVRFFCLHDVPFGSDASVAADQFTTTYNAYLANELGNLLHRAGTMVDRWLEGRIPALAGRDDATAYLELREEAVAGFDEAVRDLAFRDAILSAWRLVKWAHGHLDAEAPWDLAKAGDTDGLERVFAPVVDALAVLGTLLAVVVPGAARACREALGADPLAPTALPLDPDALFAGAGEAAALPLFAPGDRPLALPPPIFPRLEAKPAPETAPAPEEEPVNDQISIDDFAKVRLVVGEVTDARAHPDADRLLLLDLDVGEEEPRQVVAGIAGAYEPADLVGRQVVVAANLKPAKLRGEVSQGMVLAADGDSPVLLTPVERVPAGTRVK